MDIVNDLIRRRAGCEQEIVEQDGRYRNTKGRMSRCAGLTEL